MAREPAHELVVQGCGRLDVRLVRLDHVLIEHGPENHRRKTEEHDVSGVVAQVVQRDVRRLLKFLWAQQAIIQPVALQEAVASIQPLSQAACALAPNLPLEPLVADRAAFGLLAADD